MAQKSERAKVRLKPRFPRMKLLRLKRQLARRFHWFTPKPEEAP